MESVSMVEFRRDAEAIIRKVQRGKRLVLTHRGKPVLRLEPYQEPAISADDSFYSLAQLATGEGEPLTNEEIDRIVYES
jgi:prevent-host-death family protein